MSKKVILLPLISFLILVFGYFGFAYWVNAPAKSPEMAIIKHVLTEEPFDFFGLEIIHIDQLDQEKREQLIPRGLGECSGGCGELFIVSGYDEKMEDELLKSYVMKIPLFYVKESDEGWFVSITAS